MIKRKRRWSDTLQNRSMDGNTFFISEQTFILKPVIERGYEKTTKRNKRGQRKGKLSICNAFQNKNENCSNFIFCRAFILKHVTERGLPVCVDWFHWVGAPSSQWAFIVLSVFGASPLPPPHPPLWEGGGGIRRSGLLPRLISIFN